MDCFLCITSIIISICHCHTAADSGLATAIVFYPWEAPAHEFG